MPERKVSLRPVSQGFQMHAVGACHDVGVAALSQVNERLEPLFHTPIRVSERDLENIQSLTVLNQASMAMN
jgi:hypothetical protein